VKSAYSNIQPHDFLANNDADFNLLAPALCAAGDAVYSWDIVSDVIVWSHNAAEVLGAPNQHLPLTGKELAKRLFKDGSRGEGSLLNWRGGSAQGGNGAFHLELNFLPGSGACRRWLEDRGQCLFNNDGKPVRVVGAMHDITIRKEAEALLMHFATYDDVTGVLHRTKLCEKLERALIASRGSREPVAYFIVGIDNLAIINESYGYAAADEAIVEVCRRISKVAGERAVVGRAAGNKFGLVVPGCGQEQIAKLAEEFLRVVRDEFIDSTAGPICATASAGCVAVDNNVATVNAVMSGAEEALDMAKERGNDTYVIFEPSMAEDLRRHRAASVGEVLLSALNERRLVLAYQPIVNANTGNADHYECLLRLIREDGELLSAGAFIPVAEKLGFIRLIDQRVLELVAETLLKYNAAYLSVNVSGITATDAAWLSNLSSMMRGKPEAASRLVVEITETAAIDDIDESASFVTALKDLGCKVAIDDFGAGYTSFRNLKALDVDMVKIDGSFIKGLAANRDNQFFARTLVELARNFDLATVAEWVDSEEDMAMLRAYGVDFLQGFHLGKPTINAPWAVAQDQSVVH
jgi:diguanylate cyclase (GGDEF)-like protein